ncbi:amino acid ABC transporter permease [Deltaproteobacteria bacterium Smac51]|nr:amino acid ABC transporter permease [Deltaproteobacteria bacterium Smac51]
MMRDANPGQEPTITIDIGDGPAIPRPADPGLYSAWKFVMVAVPCLLLFLTTYDKLAASIASWLPSSVEDGTLGRLGAYLGEVSEKGNNYRDFFFFMPDGLAVTFQITIYSIGVALFLGIITGLCRISKIKIVNFSASVYVEVVRGIPLLVQLFYIYYAIGHLVTVPPMVTAVSAISFCYGAYMGEVVRSGIEAIDRGQREAAMSLGFTPFQSMIYVILPQAIRTILPPIGNECIAMLKDSSMVSIVAVPDIMRRAREFASTSFAYFEAYTTVTLVYLFMTLLLSKLVSMTEIHMGKNERR